MTREGNAMARRLYDRLALADGYVRYRVFRRSTRSSAFEYAHAGQRVESGHDVVEATPLLAPSDDAKDMVPGSTEPPRKNTEPFNP
jgi:hypothetical protein